MNNPSQNGVQIVSPRAADYFAVEMRTAFPPSPCTLSRRRAFSLIEVVLALGIMSFALTAIIGLLPVGLSHYQKAVDLTVQAQIGQEVVSSVQRTSYNQIDDFGNESSPTTWHYDAEGKLLPADKSDQYTYLAKVYLASPAQLGGLLAPAWIAPDGSAPTEVKAVKISISNRVSPGKSNVSTIYVPNTGI